MSAANPFPHSENLGSALHPKVVRRGGLVSRNLNLAAAMQRGADIRACVQLNTRFITW